MLSHEKIRTGYGANRKKQADIKKDGSIGCAANLQAKKVQLDSLGVVEQKESGLEVLELCSLYLQSIQKELDKIEERIARATLSKLKEKSLQVVYAYFVYSVQCKTTETLTTLLENKRKRQDIQQSLVLLERCKQVRSSRWWSNV